ncbi:MAG: DUF2306 domain-containing protein [Gammaproteobacteria bacterium]|nr:DUF2306 domain-containing protein [Gammaproteobacteria bacterium]MXY57142.1 DUF2306 domain-containing protein [Gammaproteobacteria bacterium]MYF27779.1 DUF2306 domain-containing protein [Gammaproteobacteria bacterium]MYK45727.1 DUF2306 domain-containing protein [Gammaproteobacteria bacterium]
MSYLDLAYIHLVTVVPCFLIGAFLLVRRKGTTVHKRWGRVYVVLILATAVVTLPMPAEVGPRVFDHFGFIHLFSVLVLVSVPAAIYGIRRRNIRAHRNHMVGVYVGGIVIAGTFALMPGRLLHTWLFT